MEKHDHVHVCCTFELSVPPESRFVTLTRGAVRHIMQRRFGLTEVAYT